MKNYLFDFNRGCTALEREDVVDVERGRQFHDLPDPFERAVNAAVKCDLLVVHLLAGVAEGKGRRWRGRHSATRIGLRQARSVFELAEFREQPGTKFLRFEV